VLLNLAAEPLALAAPLGVALLALGLERVLLAPQPLQVVLKRRALGGHARKLAGRLRGGCGVCVCVCVCVCMGVFVCLIDDNQIVSLGLPALFAGGDCFRREIKHRKSEIVAPLTCLDLRLGRLQAAGRRGELRLRRADAVAGLAGLAKGGLEPHARLHLFVLELPQRGVALVRDCAQLLARDPRGLGKLRVTVFFKKN
jgi:hypothetical protein